MRRCQVWQTKENYKYHSMLTTRIQHCKNIKKGKGKAVPLQVWSGPEGSRKLRFPDFMTTAQESCKVVSLKHRLPLPPGIHLC